MTDYKYPTSVEDMIAALHYHVADGNAPPELPEILQLMLTRLKRVEREMVSKQEYLDAIRQGIKDAMPAAADILETIGGAVDHSLPFSEEISSAIASGVYQAAKGKA